MTYKIKYEYQTGDSFSNNDAEGVLEVEWEVEANAQRALKSIKEHYEYYEEMTHKQRWTWPSRKAKKESEALIEQAERKEWFVAHRELQSILKLKADNGEDFQFSAPWCGMFERLYRASIFQDPDPNTIEF